MYGTQVQQIPTIAVTDSKNLWQAVHSLKSVDDRRLVGTIAEIKEAMLEDGGSVELRHLPGEYMLADGLTKKGASSEDLMRVLQTGRFNLTGGWEIQNKPANFDRRTWIDLNFEETDTENDV